MLLFSKAKKVTKNALRRKCHFHHRKRMMNFSSFKNPTMRVILRLLSLLPDFYAPLKPRISIAVSPPLEAENKL
jgi:hypothetical protein